MVGPHHKMQTGYIMPRPKGTPRRLLHFPGSGHKANISTRDKISNSKPQPHLWPGGYLLLQALVATPPSTQALGVGGEPHTSTRGLHRRPLLTPPQSTSYTDGIPSCQVKKRKGRITPAWAMFPVPFSLFSDTQGLRLR